MTRYGNPWTYVFRDVLYEANNITSALDILSNTHRTCAIHIGLSGVDDHSFRMLEYAFKTLNVYDDKNYTFTKNHPKIDGVAFFDKHVQPSGDECVAMLLRDVRMKLFSHNSISIGILMLSGEWLDTVIPQEIPNWLCLIWKGKKLMLPIVSIVKMVKTQPLLMPDLQLFWTLRNS